ncbi:MAG: AAA family ATPase [Candidatus Hydrothermae bacterium]|nr:AAA family ATPase [Candidatus Hydrothermae bacterium]
MTKTAEKYKNLSQLLLEEGYLKRADYEKALKRQWEKGGSLEENLVDLGFLSEDDLIKLLVKHFGVHYLDLSRLEIDPEAVFHIPLRVALAHKAIAVRKSKNSLAVAMANPLDATALAEIKKVTDLRIYPFVSRISDIEKAISTIYSETLGKRPSGDHELPFRISRDEGMNFGGFIEDETNSLVLSMAKSFIEGKDVKYLAIVGEPGTGKTHILQAIAGALKEKNEPFEYLSVPILALTAESQRSNMIALLEALEGKTLLLDDFEAVGDSRPSQSFMSLLLDRASRDGIKVVLATSKPPKNIESLDPSLRARVSGFVVAQLGSPSADLKKKLLRRLLGKNKPGDDIEDLIARNTSSNLREIFAIAQQLKALSRNGEVEITLGLVEQILSNFR